MSNHIGKKMSTLSVSWPSYEKSIFIIKDSRSTTYELSTSNFNCTMYLPKLNISTVLFFSFKEVVSVLFVCV